MTILAAVMAALAILFFFAGLREFLQLGRERRRAVTGSEWSEAIRPSPSLLFGLDTRLSRTTVGRWLGQELELAGLTAMPSVVLLVGVGASVAAMWAIGRFLTPVLAVVGLVVGFVVIRTYLRRSQRRRQEAIVNQLPELARVLANASFAGLSLPTALAMAASDLSEPTRGELKRVADQLEFGAPLQVALQDFRDRVGSREAGVLVSTLVVSSRSGGSIVTALRGIAASLEQRKETRRQIQTTLSGPSATATLIVILGIGILFLLNSIQPGTVDLMARHPVGVAALMISGSLFAVGFLAIRRITRIDP